MKKSLLYSLAATAAIAVSATAITAAEGDSPSASQGGYVLSVAPATGSTVKSISEIKISIPEEYMEECTFDQSFDATSITLTKEGSTPIKASGFGEPGQDGIPVVFSPVITEAGTYTLNVPAGLCIQMGSNQNGKKSDAISATYTVSADAPSMFDNYVLNPAHEETVSSIESIQLTFPDLDYSANIYSSVEGKEISITNGGTDYTASAVWDWNYEGAGKRFNIYFTDAQENDATISEAGTWYLFIEQGAFALDGEESPQIMAAYTISGGAAASLDNYVLTPQAYSEVGRLRSVKITFPDYTAQSKLFKAEDAQPATISNWDKSVTYTAEAYPLLENMDVKEIEFTFYDDNNDPVSITEDGQWTFNIPAGYFEAGTAKSEAISATYVVDSSIPPVINWTADPENGTSIEAPQEPQKIETFTFHFSDIETVSYDPVDDNAYIRVTYNGQSISQVENALEETGWQLFNNWGEACAVIRINAAVFQQPGILSIEIDNGRFTLDDAIASPEISYSCTVGDYKEYTYKILPDNSETVTDLSEITISFPEAETATINEDFLYVTLSGPMVVPGNPVVTAVEGAEHPTFSIKFPQNPSKKGSYTLTIDEGSFTLDGKQPCPLIKHQYEFSNGPVDWEWTPSPNNDLVIGPDGIFPAFIFSEAENLLSGPEYKNITVVLNGTALTTDQYEKDMSQDNNAVYFGITDEALLVPGTLTITLPAGAIRLSGEDNAEPISYTWNVKKAKEYTLALNPDAETVSSLAEIKLTIDGAETAEIFRISGVSMMGNNYAYYAGAEIVKDTDNPGTFILKFPLQSVNGPMTDGEYKLEIFRETFLVDGAQYWPGETIQKTYTLNMTSGINGIYADNDTVTVISIDGKVILKDAPASELKNLDKGVYIINGKKRIIK